MVNECDVTRRNVPFVNFLFAETSLGNLWGGREDDEISRATGAPLFNVTNI